MTRNMVRRVEVGIPVLNKNLKLRIKKIFESEMNDTEKGWLLKSDGIYERRNLNVSEEQEAENLSSEKTENSGEKSRGKLRS